MLVNKLLITRSNVLYRTSIAAYTLWFLYQNSLFSRDTSEAYLRSVDDAAFQLVFHEIQVEIYNRDWLKVVDHVEYAYGWLFWIVHSLAGFPAFLLNELDIKRLGSVTTEALTLQAPRNLSLIFTLLTAQVTRLVVREIAASHKNRSLIETLVPLMLLAMPTVGYLSGKPSPSALSNLLVALALRRPIVTYLKLQSLDRKSLLITAILLGAAVGTKTTAGFAIPVIGLLSAAVIKERKNSFTNFQVVQEFVVAASVALAAYLTTSNPHLLINFFDVEEWRNFFGSLFSYTKNATRATGDSLPQGVSNFFDGTLHPIVYTLAIASLAVARNSRAKVENATVISRLGLLTLAHITAVFLVIVAVSQDVNLERVYITAVMPSFAVVIGSLWCVAQETSVLRGLKIALVLAVAGGILASGVSRSPATLDHFEYRVKWKSSETRALLETVESLRSDLPLISGRTTSVLQSYHIPPAYSLTSDSVNQTLTFLNFTDTSWLINPDYIVVANNPSQHPELKTSSQEVPLSDQLLGESPLTRLLQNGEYGSQTCEETITRDKYIVFKCVAKLGG